MKQQDPDQSFFPFSSFIDVQIIIEYILSLYILIHTYNDIWCRHRQQIKRVGDIICFFFLAGFRHNQHLGSRQVTYTLI